MLQLVEQKKYAPCLQEAITKFAAKNISVIAKSPALDKLAKGTLVELIQQMAYW